MLTMSQQEFNEKIIEKVKTIRRKKRYKIVKHEEGYILLQEHKSWIRASLHNENILTPRELKT